MDTVNMYTSSTAKSHRKGRQQQEQKHQQLRVNKKITSEKTADDKKKKKFNKTNENHKSLTLYAIKQICIAIRGIP